ncbi:hypothetical protein ACQ4M3_38335 [Leptolyngbya sp. AN03gr2]|uniref:hypothetical protein n=1 Tax=unclassified Leptolyngbya TaxID=2650499 RepID=UPI003D30FBA3
MPYLEGAIAVSIRAIDALRFFVLELLEKRSCHRMIREFGGAIAFNSFLEQRSNIFVANRTFILMRSVILIDRGRMLK